MLSSSTSDLQIVPMYLLNFTRVSVRESSFGIIILYMDTTLLETWHELILSMTIALRLPRIGNVLLCLPVN